MCVENILKGSAIKLTYLLRKHLTYLMCVFSWRKGTLSFLTELRLFFLFFLQFNYNEFMEAWAQSVPDGMTVKAEYLLVS